MWLKGDTGSGVSTVFTFLCNRGLVSSLSRALYIAPGRTCADDNTVFLLHEAVSRSKRSRHHVTQNKPPSRSKATIPLIVITDLETNTFYATDNRPLPPSITELKSSLNPLHHPAADSTLNRRGRTSRSAPNRVVLKASCC